MNSSNPRLNNRPSRRGTYKHTREHSPSRIHSVLRAVIRWQAPSFTWGPSNQHTQHDGGSRKRGAHFPWTWRVGCCTYNDTSTQENTLPFCTTRRRHFARLCAKWRMSSYRNEYRISYVINGSTRMMSATKEMHDIARHTPGTYLNV